MSDCPARVGLRRSASESAIPEQKPHNVAIDHRVDPTVMADAGADNKAPEAPSDPVIVSSEMRHYNASDPSSDDARHSPTTPISPHYTAHSNPPSSGPAFAAPPAPHAPVHSYPYRWDQVYPYSPASTAAAAHEGPQATHFRRPSYQPAATNRGVGHFSFQHHPPPPLPQTNAPWPYSQFEAPYAHAPAPDYNYSVDPINSWQQTAAPYSNWQYPVQQTADWQIPASQYHDAQSRRQSIASQPHSTPRSRQSSIVPPIDPVTAALQLRGPPHKPRMAGCAVWVGNVPVGISIEKLRDFFSDGFKDSIISVFPILKSNSAFINYSNESDCEKALARCNGVILHNSRLVCRLRIGAQPDSSAPSPTALHSSSSFSGPHGSQHPSKQFGSVSSGGSSHIRGSSFSDGSTGKSVLDGKIKSDGAHDGQGYQGSDRFFVMKALTVDDLVLSRSQGIWMTQPHNEQRLVQALKNSTNVYLIFSANRSGEFYGYARITGIQQMRKLSGSGLSVTDQSTAQNFPPPAEVVYTKETSIAPAGYIFKDHSRGTLFWDAGEPQMELLPAPGDGDGEKRYFVNSFSTGSQFLVEWADARRVQFKETQHLVNQHGGNTPVQIAKDGTEIDPNVGRRLLDLFTSPELRGYSDHDMI